MNNAKGYRYYYETDYSRFDASISAEMLASFEFNWLTLVYPCIDYPSLATALVSSVKTKGIHETGIVYNVFGTRCSGDAHTSIGNGVLNHFLTFLMTSHLDDLVTYHEGDDGLICVNENIDDSFDILPQLGFMVKVDCYGDINDASFCGMCLDEGDCESLDMFSDPFRCLAKIHTACADGFSKNLIVAKAMSILNLNPSTPIITAFCEHILNVVDSPLLRPNRRERFLRMISNLQKGSFKHQIDLGIKSTEISATKRANFLARTGLSPGYQVKYENYLRSLREVPAKYELIKRDVVLETADSTLFNFHECLYA